MPASPLPEGIYEHLLTRDLTDALPQPPVRADVHPVDRSDLPGILSRHIAVEVERALRDIATEEGRLALAHALLERMADLAPDTGLAGSHVPSPAQMLHAIYRTAAPLRTASPLASSTLLTRARTEPALGHELAREISSANRIDVLSAFMGRGLPIRDASPGNTGGMFLNAERNLLESRGWTFDSATNLWMPPGG